MLGRSEASAPDSPDFFSSAFMIWNSSALAARKSAALAALSRWSRSDNPWAGDERHQGQVQRQRRAQGQTGCIICQAVSGCSHVQEASTNQSCTPSRACLASKPTCLSALPGLPLLRTVPGRVPQRCTVACPSCCLCRPSARQMQSADAGCKARLQARNLVAQAAAAATDQPATAAAVVELRQPGEQQRASHPAIKPTCCCTDREAREASSCTRNCPWLLKSGPAGARSS